eukprot:COSAG02_NODE_4427_length_5372_cov_4.047791_3_plen_368_part_00
MSTSRYWFNYRHTTNALTIYHRLRRAGVSDDNIVLMLADDFACDPRNPERGRIYNDLAHSDDIFRDVVVDYRGSDVSSRNFLNVLSGRHVPGTAATQRLQSDGNSDLLVYMTGHGGDEFLKFRDFEEMTANDLAIAISEAHIGRRYRAFPSACPPNRRRSGTQARRTNGVCRTICAERMLIMADTCEAHSLSACLTPEETPEVGFVSSSLRTENSYSKDSDKRLGVLITDRWTHFVDSHLSRAGSRPLSIAALMDLVQRENLMSNIGRHSTMSVPLSKVNAKDFLMDPAEPIQLVPTHPLPVQATDSLPPPSLSPKASGAGSVDQGNHVGTVPGLTGYALISTTACQAVGGLAAAALVTGAAACTLM